jgi:hypothetical protein
MVKVDGNRFHKIFRPCLPDFNLRDNRAGILKSSRYYLGCGIAHSNLAKTTLQQRSGRAHGGEIRYAMLVLKPRRDDGSAPRIAGLTPGAKPERILALGSAQCHFFRDSPSSAGRLASSEQGALLYYAYTACLTASPGETLTHGRRRSGQPLHNPGSGISMLPPFT